MTEAEVATKEIERKWLLNVDTADPVNVLIPNPKPMHIVQIYLNNVELGDHLVRYTVKGDPRVALRVELEDKSPWVYEPEPWAGAVLNGAAGAVRVRSQLPYALSSPQHILVIKSEGSDERNETPDLPISEEVALVLAGLPNLGQPVQKWRYAWGPKDAGTHPYELDVFVKQLTGLVVLEREFATREERYGNLSLAVHGLPAD